MSMFTGTFPTASALDVLHTMKDGAMFSSDELKGSRHD